MTEAWKRNAQKAQAYRLETQEKVEKYFHDANSKHNYPLPDPLPLNVTTLRKTYLTSLDYEITSIDDASELLEKIKNRTYTSVQVTGAYIRAAVLAHRCTNCVTEFLADMAYERALELDKYMDEHDGQTVGPLHGLPVSFKDCVAFKGKFNNYATTALVDHITDYDSSIVKIMRDAGAVFYQRTAQPQNISQLETLSFVYGRTVNPFNTKLSCGGSSGGEGASMGMKSSIIGFGTDIGGSVRDPAGLQGAYGYKPTTNLFPINDTYLPINGPESIENGLGILARTLNGVELISRIIVAAQAWRWRPEMTAKPWDSKTMEGKRKLRIGIMRGDGLTTPQPPVRRALKLVEEKLKAAGRVDDIAIEVVEYEPLDHVKNWNIIAPLYYEDGSEREQELLARTNEPLTPLAKWIYVDNPLVRKLTIHELWDLNAEKAQYRDDYIANWRKLGLDVVLSPNGTGPAQPHDSTIATWSYLSAWNLLQYPAISFPVTVVNQELDTAYAEDEKPLNDVDKQYFDRYKPSVYKDCPVALQLIAAGNENEFLLEALKVVEKAMGR